MTPNQTATAEPASAVSARLEAAAAQAKAAAAERTSKAIRREADRTSGEAQRERPAQFGGPRLKLGIIGELESGWHPYWCNDEDAAIEQLLYEGFEFVTPDEVKMESWIVQDSDIANKISKYVGRKADGTPLRAFLLKCTEETWAERQAYGQQQANAWDSAIRAGAVANVDNRYHPAGADIKLNTQRVD